MSKYGDYIKSVKEKNIKFFFGDDVNYDGKHVQWKHFKDEDTILIATSNVRYWKNKEQYVLIVDNNKVVYLKEWQVTLIKNWNLGINGYAVKLNRKFFKAYTMPFAFEDVGFSKEDTFDELVECAKEQDQVNLTWKLGHYDCL